MNAFAKMVDGLTRVCTILALISMLAMMALITGDVIMNKVASRPIPGTIEITSFYFMVHHLSAQPGDSTRLHPVRTSADNHFLRFAVLQDAADRNLFHRDL